MLIPKEKIIEKLKEAKQLYGFNYSQLARELGVQPVTIYMFVSGKSNMSQSKQLKAVCIAEKYIEQVKEELKILEHKGLCMK